MKQITLLYHDVLEAGAHQQSGFPDPAAARYKLGRAAFVEHLQSGTYDWGWVVHVCISKL